MAAKAEGDKSAEFYRNEAGQQVPLISMAPQTLEKLFDKLGHFGRFQASVYFLVNFQTIACGIHYLASVFLAATPQFLCKLPGNMTTILVSNSTADPRDLWNLWIPESHSVIAKMENGEIWEAQQCSRFKINGGIELENYFKGNKSRYSCSDGFIYDQSHIENSIVTDWNLVCDRAWLAKLSQPIFMLGVLLGAVAFGDIADRFGRRSILWFTSVAQFVFGVAVAFTNDYYSFIIVRFLLALVASGYLVVVFVYVTEYTGLKARSWASMHVHAYFAVGIMVVALVGFLVRTWRLYQLILSVVTVPFIFFCWLLPETPWWLLAKGRIEDVQKLVDRIAQWNRVKIPCHLSVMQMNSPEDSTDKEVANNQHKNKQKKMSILDLFRTCDLVKRTITIWLVWFTGSLGYYVSSLGSVNLGGNEYLNLFLAGAVEIPSYIVACIVMDRLGRRNTLAPSLFLTGITCVLSMVIPQDIEALSITLSMIGKFAIAVAFGLIYLYTAELYPTIIRSLAVGSGSMMARVGSTVAPFCVLLSSVWIFLPQLIVGIMSFLTGFLTLLLPETLGRPLTQTFEEAAELQRKLKQKKEASKRRGSGAGMVKIEKEDYITDGVEKSKEEQNLIEHLTRL
ncbi:solute carrier family 22 member 16 isoform X1 [Hemitrygon akajei]|uniref:solute carrier family 22 member 16 isoform X1 n=1 Tax=Hemitrygon akajei TaxID=2704970 RepID=UPI003BFA0453